jgi:hypothetical protein
MNIEHCGFLSWFHARHESPAHKNHAQDCGTLIVLVDQRPAILPWSRCAGWHSSFRSGTGKGILAFNPRDRHLARHRPVAGVLLDELLPGHEIFSKQRFEERALMRAIDDPHMIYAWFLAKSRKAAFCETTRKNARHKRA